MRPIPNLQTLTLDQSYSQDRLKNSKTETAKNPPQSLEADSVSTSNTTKYLRSIPFRPILNSYLNQNQPSETKTKYKQQEGLTNYKKKALGTLSFLKEQPQHIKTKIPQTESAKSNANYAIKSYQDFTSENISSQIDVEL